MFEAVGVLAVSACILQMVYEKFDEQRTTVDYTEENKQFQQQKLREAEENARTILPYLEQEKAKHEDAPVIQVQDLTMRFQGIYDPDAAQADVVQRIICIKPYQLQCV